MTTKSVGGATTPQKVGDIFFFIHGVFDAYDTSVIYR